MKLSVIRDKYRNDSSSFTFSSPTIDFLILHKNNWRTKFKLETMYSICGCTDNLEMHHIKPIRLGLAKRKEYKGFDQLVASLGRKQILVCKQCHVKIGSGKYSGISMQELFDIRIVAPESLLKKGIPKVDTPESQIDKEAKKKKKKDNIIIDEYNKTYINLELSLYYQKIKDNIITQ
jgi:hypothetical protein